MMAIEKLARAGLPKEARELLDLAAAKEETAAIAAEGGRPTDFILRPCHTIGPSGQSGMSASCPLSRGEADSIRSL